MPVTPELEREGRRSVILSYSLSSGSGDAACGCTCMHIPEVSQCPPQLLPTWLFETGSLPEPGTQQLDGPASQCAPEIDLCLPRLSFPLPAIAVQLGTVDTALHGFWGTHSTFVSLAETSPQTQDRTLKQNNKQTKAIRYLEK